MDLRKPILLPLIVVLVCMASHAPGQTSEEGVYLAITPHAELYREKADQEQKKQKKPLPCTQCICAPQQKCKPQPKSNNTTTEKSGNPAKNQDDR
ncbi:MAG: hypothetical protein R3C61_09705 [Bacteroidia bacterium]